MGAKIDVSVLKTQIPVDDTVGMMKLAAESEVIAYQAAEAILMREERLAELEHQITITRMTVLSQNASDKVAVAQAKADEATSDATEEATKLEANIKYWKYLGKLVENRTSLIQSMLSYTTSTIKAGITR